MRNQSIETRRDSATSTIFLGGFGALWLLIGLLTSGTANMLALLTLGCAAAILLVPAWLILRQPAPESPSDPEVERTFKRVNIAQYAGIFAAIVFANIIQRPDLIPVIISVVVALHFLPLARLFRRSRYYLTTAAILTVDMLAVWHAPSDSSGFAALGTGSVLWLSAAMNQYESGGWCGWLSCNGQGALMCRRIENGLTGTE